MRIPEIPKISLKDEPKVITLVCFLIKNLTEVTESNLLEIVTSDDVVTQFRLSDALSVIEKKKLAVLDKVKKTYTLTKAGEDWLHEFENTLPVTFRKRLIRQGRETLRLSELKKAAKWRISRNKDDVWTFYVCFMNETDGSPVMEIKIHSKTRDGAERIQAKFLENPAKVLKDSISGFI